MKKTIFLCIAFVFMVMSACGNQNVVPPTGNTSTIDWGNSTTEQSSDHSTSPLGSSDVLGNVDKATDNEWYSNITCAISEPTQTDFGEKRMISVSFKNATRDKEFLSFGFVAMLFDADGKPINAIVERFGDNINLNPGEVFDRDEWIVPLDAQQAKVCIKSIVYRDSGEKTWENPYIYDWITTEKDLYWRDPS